MSRPNLNPAPQPEDGIILRGAIQIETALLALRASGLNPALQTDLDHELEWTQRLAAKAETAGIPLNNTWVTLHSDEAKTARHDILTSLERAESDDTNPQLALSAQALRNILTSK